MPVPRGSWHLTRRDFWAISLLAASMIAMFWRVIFTSAMFFYRDVANYTYPTTRLIRELCRHGSLPYWNPYLNYGQPILANPNLLFFYPYTLALIFLPFDLAYIMHFVLHFTLAAVGAYLLARVWGQSYVAAFFAGFIFAFSGQILSLGNVYNTAACTAWIPWALLATDRALNRRSLRSWILVVSVFSLQWLAAEPLTFMGTFALCLAYALYRRGRRDRIWCKENLYVVAIFGVVGCLTLLLCAAQLLPASGLLSNSRRGQGLRFSETAEWAVHPFALLDIVIAGFAGQILATPSGWGWLMSDQMGTYNPSDFLGFVPFFFALAGWAAGKDRRRNFAAAAAVVLLLLAFGHYTPVFSLAYLLIPTLAFVRFPIKLLVHFTFLLAILAGWGFDALRTALPPWKAPRKRLVLPVLVSLACVLAVLAVAWLAPELIVWPTRYVLHKFSKSTFQVEGIPGFLVHNLRFYLPGLAGFCIGGLALSLGLQEGKRWARPGVYAFALVGMAQLVAVNSGANPAVPKSFLTFRPPVLERFQEAASPYRFISLAPVVSTSDAENIQTYVNFESTPEAAHLPEVALGAFQARLQLSCGTMLNLLEGSITIDQERALPSALYDLEFYLHRHRKDRTGTSCLLGRTNVKYIITPEAVDSPALRPMGKVFNGSAQPGNLYDARCFVPRAFVAEKSVFTNDSKQTLDRMASLGFDALNTVILAPPAGSPSYVPAASLPVEAKGGSNSLASAPRSATGPAGEVEIVHRDPNSVTLQVQLARPAYVVLMDRYDVNWQATLDGHPTPAWRADQLFRAVYAGAGRHEVRFEYHQHGLLPGLAISLLTLAALITLWFSPWGKRSLADYQPSHG